MASDIVLVLRSEHRELLELAQQCARTSRGFHDPLEELRRRLTAHLAAVAALRSGRTRPQALDEAVETLSATLSDPAGGRLAQAARALVATEQEGVLPQLAVLPVGDRRRMGKVFRIKRESSLRHSGAPMKRRQRSQTELYELARRAGVEQRSRMTLAQLEEAVTAWERNQAGRSQTP